MKQLSIPDDSKLLQVAALDRATHGALTHGGFGRCSDDHHDHPCARFGQHQGPTFGIATISRRTNEASPLLMVRGHAEARKDDVEEASREKEDLKRQQKKQFQTKIACSTHLFPKIALCKKLCELDYPVRFVMQYEETGVGELWHVFSSRESRAGTCGDSFGIGDGM